MRCRAVAGWVVGVGLGWLALAARVQAQYVWPDSTGEHVDSTGATVELYAAAYSSETALTGSRTGRGGIGLRLMFGLGPTPIPAHSILQRTKVGAFIMYTASSDNNPKVWNVGAEGDLPIFRAPLARWLDPFVSVGLGWFRASVGQGNGLTLVDSHFAATPGAGALFRITDRVHLRGDLRMPIVFGSATRLQYVAEGGLAVSF